MYLAYGAPGGSAFIDRTLYVPQFWTENLDRCRAAWVAGDVVFATKLALARRMIGRGIDAWTPAALAPADEVYGQDPKLHAELARRGLGYILAVAGSHPFTTAIGICPAIELARRLPARAWQRPVALGPAPRAPAGMTGA